MDKQKELVSLANAHVTQLTNKGKRSDWAVRENITNNLLFTLDPTYTEKQVFEIMDFAREFEILAFNAGAEFERKKWKTTVANMERQYNSDKEQMRMENDRLASILDKHIGEDA